MYGFIAREGGEEVFIFSLADAETKHVGAWSLAWNTARKKNSTAAPPQGF